MTNRTIMYKQPCKFCAVHARAGAVSARSERRQCARWTASSPASLFGLNDDSEMRRLVHGLRRRITAR